MCFQCVDTLLFASKHAKGMSLRYDAIFALSDNLISEDWFFAEGERFFPFGDATALAGEGGVGDVVWLIQAPA